MCGLSGEINFDGKPADAGALQRMTEALAPRGPDGVGVVLRGPVGFGHRRLKIIDLSEKAQQPMADADLGITIVFNGCIYNYPELREELIGLGYRFFSHGDTEVIIKAWHAWGDRCVDRFLGMFAFVLHERDSGRLVIARDRFGIKPLYLAEQGKRLRFASSLPSLLAGGDVDTSIDPVGMHHYMTFHAVVPPPHTILKGVRKLPPATLSFITYPTKFDTRVVERALKGSKITVPDLDSYAWRIWDYWERHLDPDLFVDRTLRGHVSGKVVLITGGSSGIGKATAIKVAEAGAKVIIVARGEEELFRTRDEILAAGGKCWAYTCDLTDLSSCDKLVATVLAEHKAVDVLVNNAGRSIRRSVELSYDRFHDYERTMQLNYFGCLRLIMGFLPAMTQRRRGQVVNISSIGVLASSPRFSAYVASKAALDAFSRCAQAEFSGKNIAFTTVNMPLVKTPMIAPTKMYESVPTLTPEEAADLVVRAIIERPSRVATRMGIFAATLNAVAPKAYEVIMNTAFEMFPDSAAAKGDRKALRDEKPTNEQVAFAALMRGVHW